jgi:hypothetical protein
MFYWLWLQITSIGYIGCRSSNEHLNNKYYHVSDEKETEDKIKIYTGSAAGSSRVDITLMAKNRK